MDTTNQNAASTPKDGEGKLNQDTPNNSESSQQDAKNATEEQSKEAPHILKPEEDHAILRGVNK